MAKKIASLLPSTDHLLGQFGDRLRLARLRRGLSAKQVSERAGMAPMTLRSLERGGSGVTIGAYLAVMQILGVEKDFNLLAQSDLLGRELQDARLASPRRIATLIQTAQIRPENFNRPEVGLTPPGHISEIRSTLKLPKALDHAPKKPIFPTEEDWVESGGFISSRALADLIVPTSVTTKKGR